MREIKFRAWIKKEKVIVDVDLIDFRENEIVCLEYCDIGLDFNYSFKDIELMQYTGLKDKNGKEIYEGDYVILLTKENVVKGTVVYHNGGFCIDFKGEYIIIVQSHIDLQYEVIGNIYENHELWEVEE